MTIQDDPVIGTELDGYLIEKLLGAGGMARVYRAQEVRLGRYAALKVILPEARTDPEYTRRFEIEARAVAALQHPGIVSVYRFGEAQGLYYMAMEFIEGADLGWLLSDYRSRGEFMPPDDALKIVRQLAGALDYAHSRGVIHRDFKPANVMVDKDGRAVLTDFGLALMLMEGTRGEIFGTPHYIAPEQAVSSAGALPASDQYSLGVMLYEIFTGSLPFDGKSPMDIAMAHMSDPVPSPLERNPDLNPALVEILEKVLAKEPENRYSSCSELAAALEQTIRYSGQPALSSTRVSMLKVTDEVRQRREANPLPPLPAPIQAAKSAAAAGAVATAPAAPVTPPSQPTRTSSLLRPTEPHHIWQTAGLASLVVVGIGMLVLALMLSQRNASTVTPTMTASTQPEQVANVAIPTDILAEPSPGPVSSTPVPTAVPTETSVPATLTAAPPTDVVTVSVGADSPSPLPPTVVPTTAPQLWTLLLLANGDESFYIVNQSPADLPAFSVAQFIFVAGNRGYIIAQWEGLALNPGDCVRLEKNKNAAGSSCNVLEQVKMGGNQRFWQDGDTLVIYYGNWIGQCTGDQLHSNSGCTLYIPTSVDLNFQPDRWARVWR